MELLLASHSPRRRELLAALDIPFRVVSVRDAEETYPLHYQQDMIPSYLSRQKSEMYLSEHALSPQQVLITADTLVFLGEKKLGKPRNEHEAVEMLHALSGKEHTVITGVTIAFQQDEQVHFDTFNEVTIVTFRTLTSEQIRYYVERYRPLDKAGAYGIQEWIGYVGIERIVGDYYNVMGLPLGALYQHLMKIKLR